MNRELRQLRSGNGKRPPRTPESKEWQSRLFGLYRSMVRIRLAEEKIVEVYSEQEMRCPVHLHIGQEAVSAGVAAHLDGNDRLFASHRSHGPYLALGGDLHAFYAELYGRESGCCRGRGGSMHLLDRSVGYWGSSALVGGTIPIAVGAALAAVHERSGRVAVCFFGDGAVDEGVFYESLNFAALKKLPVLFVCENNFYATNSPQRRRHALDNIHERATVLGVEGLRVDGNDALAISDAAGSAILKARSGGGPTLLEARTYRWKGHVGPAGDTDLGHRPLEELESWLERCPIRGFRERVTAEGWLDEVDLQGVVDAVTREVERAISSARQAPFPQVEAFLGEAGR